MTGKLKEQISIHSGIPVVYCLWVVAYLACIGACVVGKIHVIYTLIICSILGLVLYYVLAQYACKFLLDEQNLEISYLFSLSAKIIHRHFKSRKGRMQFELF
jgi:hypothetical protein